MQIRPQVATGLSYGQPQKIEHVERAVKRALEKLSADRANSVLLFTTSDYAHNPTPALRAAARVASCTQVIGCTSVGLITEDEWILDSSGAAAMVFTGSVNLGVTENHDCHDLRLALTTPEALSISWLDQPVSRVGAVTSDELGHGPFCVWNGSKVRDEGFAEATIRGVEHSVGVAQGIRVLTAPMEVDEASGYELKRLDKHSALHVLLNALPQSVRTQKRIPLHLLMCGVTFGAPQDAIQHGRFRLDHIVSADPEQRSVTLTNELRPGERLFWAMRDRLAAERDIQIAMEQCHQTLDAGPDFAFLFPCLSRGPGFFGGTDRDVEITRSAFPDTPFIGFYGNGEIAPLNGHSYLHQYSTVVAGFRYRT